MRGSSNTGVLSGSLSGGGGAPSRLRESTQGGGRDRWQQVKTYVRSGRGEFKGISGPGPMHRENSHSAPGTKEDGSRQAYASGGESEGADGVGSGSDWSSGSDSSGEGGEERTALKALRRQQLAYLAQHWQHNELVKHQVRW